ncbi:hypothetical protein KUH03_23105 [Sphingobacterium sp. E70]|nr:hypothetical protein [Sphingobacterium sp. E70]ULT22330.1 hypothetical protein KUH03_23105 [Sphingobacterium sp. E70]
MKKFLSPLFLGIAALALFTVSCSKSEDAPVYDAEGQFKTDSTLLKNYVDSKYPNAQYDSEKGIWYEILAEGEGNYQYKIVDTLNAKLFKVQPTVKYTGRLLNGSIFDQTETDKTASFEILTNTGYYYPFESTIIPAWTFAFAPKKIGDLKLGDLPKKDFKRVPRFILWFLLNGVMQTVQWEKFQLILL